MDSGVPVLVQFPIIASLCYLELAKSKVEPTVAASIWSVTDSSSSAIADSFP
jgi:hypothetical protein